MQRRQFTQSTAAIGLLILAAHQQARALSLGDLSEGDATKGIKAALEKGALAAVALLGKTDGFLGNPKVRIPLPGFLEDASKLLKLTGQGKRIDELVTSMNRAAEAAVPMGKDLLVNAVKSMSVTDAKNILGGGDNSVTQFFAEKTRTPLQQGGRQGRGHRAGQVRRRQHPEVRHRQVARWPLHHHWRRRTQDPPGPGGHRQRHPQEGVWRHEVSAGWRLSPS
jgi:Protein of unknown function (DUF4197)